MAKEDNSEKDSKGRDSQENPRFVGKEEKEEKKVSKEEVKKEKPMQDEGNIEQPIEEIVEEESPRKILPIITKEDEKLEEKVEEAGISKKKEEAGKYVEFRPYETGKPKDKDEKREYNVHMMGVKEVNELERERGFERREERKEERFSPRDIREDYNSERKENTPRTSYSVKVRKAA